MNRRLLNGDEVLPIIEDVKSELEAAHRDEARGVRIRANVQWAEVREASTKYFFGLERKRGQRRIFTSIKNMAGTVVSTFVGIARAWVAFDGLLFTSQCLDRTEQDFFLTSLSLKLSRDEQSLCEGELTEGECKRALDVMATGKSPVLDGLPAEFYQRFWSVLGADLVDVINFAYIHGQLSPSQRSGVITLIHKRGDRLDMKTPLLSTLHWLPIKYRIEFKVLLLTYKTIHGQAPIYLQELLTMKHSKRYNLRTNNSLMLDFPSARSYATLGDRAFVYAAPKLWDALPGSLRMSASIDIFKKSLKTFLFKKAFA